MFNSKRRIILCDMTSKQDEETGDRVRVVSNGKIIVGDKTLVGVNTQTLAQLQNMNFNYSIVIDRMYYKDQKYLYIDKKLYKIQNVSPAKLPKDCKLNVSELEDEDIKNAIERWLDDIQ
jgi:hypothetical protein